jgi:DNA-binding response OmpR family regulator
MIKERFAEARWAESPAPLASAKHEERTMNDNKKRILVVDDEPSITRLLKLNLEQTGDYEVTTENVSKAAMGTAEEFRPDLILLDVMMPDRDGGDLALAFETSPTTKGVQIVFLTAAVTRDEVSKRDGMFGGYRFLAKPVDLREVLACLEQYLGAPRVPVATGR